MFDATGRVARLSRHNDGNPLGAPLYLTNEELELLGIDPDVTEQIEFGVVEGRIEVKSVTGA